MRGHLVAGFALVVVTIVACSDEHRRSPAQRAADEHAAGIAHAACHWFELRFASATSQIGWLEDSWVVRHSAHRSLFTMFGPDGESYYLFGCDLDRRGFLVAGWRLSDTATRRKIDSNNIEMSDKLRRDMESLGYLSIDPGGQIRAGK